MSGTIRAKLEPSTNNHERIRQIEAKALRKLRHPSRSRKLKAFVDGVKELSPNINSETPKRPRAIAASSV
jgi:hypothetical protein